MAAIANERFPSCSESRIVLSRPSCGPQLPNGGGGPPGGLVVFPWVTLERLAEPKWQPVAAVAAEEIQRLDDSPCWIQRALLDRVTWWIVELAFVGTGAAPATPPQFSFEIRPATAGVSDLALDGLTVFSTYQDNGELAQASGVACGQWELWAQLDSAEAVGTKLRVQVACAANGTGGGVFSTRYGLLAVAPPT